MKPIQFDNDRPGAAIQVICVAAAVIPMAALAAWLYRVRDAAPDLAEFFLGPMLIGGAVIFWLLFLHLVVCRDGLQSLGFRLPGFRKDIVAGCLLALTFLLLKHLTDPFLRGLFETRPPSVEILRLIRTVAAEPWLLALWLGPVVWIGVAGFEELWRVFVLRRLWSVLSGPAGRWLAVLAVSALIGLAHGYQGPAAILSIGFKSVLMSAWYLYTGRGRALIVAHAVYDSVQIAWAVYLIRYVAP